VGSLTLPSLHLSWSFYEGTTEKQLALGIGHFRRSVLQGERFVLSLEQANVG
jgi:sortase (surface protein transpeptidase)